jgi:hypothetical protein
VEKVVEWWRGVFEDPLKRRIVSTVWLLLWIRGAQFLPLPGFRNAPSEAAGVAAGNVVNLLLPSHLTQADLTGERICCLHCPAHHARSLSF